MIISISKSEIFNEVEKRTSLEGSVIPERSEGIWASEEEGQFLDSFWIEGYTAVIQMMKRYLSNDTVGHSLSTYDKDEVLSIQADMPDRYNSLLDENVSTDVKMLIACNIINGWLKIKLPESAPKYVDEAKEYSQDLKAKLLYRSAPTRTIIDPVNDSNEIEGEESYLNAADSDTEKMESESYLNAADSDTESFLKEEYISKAKKDSDRFEKGEYIRKADSDTNGFDKESYLNGADTDHEEIGKTEGDTFASDRKCFEENIYPQYEFIGKCDSVDKPMHQGWNNKFECRRHNKR